jgi:hypothetical protein
MDPTSIVVVFVVIVVVIIVLVAVFSKEARLKRKMRALRPTPIDKAVSGQVTKLVGKLVPVAPPILAPLSGKPCAFYEVVVEEWRRTGRSGSYVRVIHETNGQDFLLEDATGRAFVRIAGAQTVVVRDGKFKSGTFNDASPTLQTFLDKHGRKSTGLLGFNKGMRYYEGVFEPGETVTVVGVAAREHDPDPAAGFAGYREQPTRVIMARAGEQPLLVSDDPSVRS